MQQLTLRLQKGTPLTNQEIDDNFTNIYNAVTAVENDKLNATDFNSNDILTEILAVDGSGSGLDADLLDGYDSATAATANTIVLRNASGQISASQFQDGDFYVSAGKNIIYEGATNNAYETTINVVDPSADRTITFPNESGTVVLTGGSGSLGSSTNDMLAGGITNSKLQYSTISINGESVSLGSNINTIDNNYDWAGAHKFTDTNFTLKDNADNTKLVQFQLSSISSNTTRTLVLPNENSTLATQDYVQRTGYNSQGVKTISTAAPSGGSNGDVWYRV